MKESIVWPYRLGRPLVLRLFLDRDDDLIRQFYQFSLGNEGLGTKKDYVSSFILVDR